MKRLLFVYNPYSGAGQVGKGLADILDIFTKAGYEVVAYPTQAAGDGEKKIKAEGHNYDRIVVAGGDGMLNEMINGVMHIDKEVTVGYIPRGTVNDFATSHKIPKNNILEAARIAVSDNVKGVDVGKFGDRYFGYVAAFGIATDVSYTTPQKEKKRWRFLAYVATFIRKIFPKRWKSYSRRMVVKAGDVVLRGEFIVGMISNSKSIASLPFFVDKEVLFDDGKVEALFLLRPKTLREWNELRKNLQLRDFSKSRLMFVRAEKIEIYSQTSAAWSLDGESGGEHEKVEINVYKQALKIALPIEAGKEENSAVK